MRAERAMAMPSATPRTRRQRKPGEGAIEADREIERQRAVGDHFGERRTTVVTDGRNSGGVSFSRAAAFPGDQNHRDRSNRSAD